MTTPTIVNLAEHRQGRRALPHNSYVDAWAKRYPKAQQAIERNRLKEGRAKHRAHRLILKSMPPQSAA